MTEQIHCLIGNPNTGKTSLFNELTTSYAYVGNWSGVTVEKKLGNLKTKRGTLIDLPGIYDLSPVSEDERIVTHFLLEEKFDDIVNIIDAANLERNLLLTIQLLELGAPLLIGLNMIDVALGRGAKIDIPLLTRKLKAPIFPVIARKGKGVDEILVALGEEAFPRRPLKIDYGEHMERAIRSVETIAAETITKKKARFIAIQLLLHNHTAESLISSSALEKIRAIRTALQSELKQPIEDHVYEVRHLYVKTITEEVWIPANTTSTPLSDKLDRIFTHKIFGIPLFLAIMWLILQVTFTWVGSPLSDLLYGFISGPLTVWITQFLHIIGASGFLTDLLVEGVVAGVGSVLVFVPQILVIFFFISLLEDSGYMARIAVVMDRLMEMFGLNGKAFIPMIIGFGCNVPGIMAARSIEEKKERLLTILVSPFMSCSARLPVYALFVGVFFKQYQALVVLSLYVIGIVLALVVTKILSKTILKNDSSIFVVELPPYRLPSAKTIWRSTAEKGKGFIKKAGTFIFAGSVVIWLLNYCGPNGVDVPMGESFLAMIGKAIAPLLAPLGFGFWQAGATLIPGFLAKEVIISTMSIIYATNDASLAMIITSHYTSLSAYCFMLFILLYIPCLATVAAIRKETTSWKWTVFATFYPLMTAYLIVLLVYQIGRLF